MPNQTKTNSYLANCFIRRGERRENLKGNVVDCQRLDNMLDRKRNESVNDWDTIDLLERHVLSIRQDQALEQIHQLGTNVKGIEPTVCQTIHRLRRTRCRSIRIHLYPFTYPCRPGT